MTTIPPHRDHDPDYRISDTHYRTVHGRLLWTESMRSKRMHGPGETIYYQGMCLRIRRVALADGIQHVNVEPGDRASNRLPTAVTPPSEADPVP